MDTLIQKYTYSKSVTPLYFLSISISFLYFLSRSARNKGRKNATDTDFELENVMQFMGFRVFESALGSLRSGKPALEINIFQIRNTIILYCKFTFISIFFFSIRQEYEKERRH